MQPPYFLRTQRVLSPAMEGNKAAGLEASIISDFKIE